MNEIPQYVYDLIGICLFVGMWVGGVLLIWFIFSNGRERRIARQLAQLMLQDGPNNILPAYALITRATLRQKRKAGIMNISRIHQAIPMKITVFTAPDCPKCRMTLTRFSLAGVDVNEIPLVDNADLVRLTQNTGAPLVVVVNDSGRVTGWGGFRPDLIATTANGWSVGSLDIPPSLVNHVLH
ncbi:glutaredoxin-like protein NrdH [Escherichia coli]|nr:glutaredoxin-like protein NrdH [Escherichia coli]